MGDWEPMGIREGWRVDEAPYEGVPDHMSVPLQRWIRQYLGGEYTVGLSRDQREKVHEVMASKMRMKLDGDFAQTIIMYTGLDSRKVFEAIDMSLVLTSGAGAKDLDLLLNVAGSVWTLDGKWRGLERRVDPAEKEAFVRAVSPTDEASDHLRSAWAEAFGVTPNPSRAWSDAIKAVEALLWNLVIPKNDKATLGSIISALDGAAHKWTFRLSPSGPLGGVAAFTQTLRFIWPNPDRHGSGTVRIPGQQEAEDVVRTAVLIVGWLRGGALAQVP